MQSKRIKKEIEFRSKFELREDYFDFLFRVGWIFLIRYSSNSILPKLTIRKMILQFLI